MLKAGNVEIKKNEKNNWEKKFVTYESKNYKVRSNINFDNF